MASLWNWFVQTSTSSWVLASLVGWFLVHWLETSALKKRVSNIEALVLSKLKNTPSGFFETQHSDGGPYRVSDKPAEARPYELWEPAFKKGDEIEVRHRSRGAWYRATFEGFTQNSTADLYVVLESKHTEQYLESSIQMRHVKTEEYTKVGDR